MTSNACAVVEISADIWGGGGQKWSKARAWKLKKFKLARSAQAEDCDSSLT